MADDEATAHSERSMVVYSLTFRKKYARHDENGTDEGNIIKPSDVCGVGICSIFEKWCAAKLDSHEYIHRDGSHNWGSIGSCRSIDDNKVLVVYQSGQAGEGFAATDITSPASVKDTYGTNYAPMVSPRQLLYVRNDSDRAFLCVEHIVHSAGDTDLMTAFGHDFSIGADTSSVTMKRSRELTERELSYFKGIRSISVKTFASSANVADDIRESAGRLTCSLSNKPRKYLPISLFDRICKRPAVAGELMGMEIDLDEKAEVLVTLVSQEGQSREIKVGEKLLLPFREVLNEEGHEKLDEESFIMRCVEACDGILENTGSK